MGRNCGGAHGIFSITDSGFHLINDFSMTSNFFFLHKINEVLILAVIHKIIDILSVSDEILGKITIVIAANSITFRIDKIRKKTQTVTGFFLTNIASARFLDNFRRSDLDGGFALTRTPKTLIRFHIKTNNRREVSLHWLVFFERQSQDEKEKDDWSRKECEERKNLKESSS